MKNRPEYFNIRRSCRLKIQLFGVFNRKQYYCDPLFEWRSDSGHVSIFFKNIMRFLLHPYCKELPFIFMKYIILTSRILIFFQWNLINDHFYEIIKLNILKTIQSCEQRMKNKHFDMLKAPCKHDTLQRDITRVGKFKLKYFCKCVYSYLKFPRTRCTIVNAFTMPQGKTSSIDTVPL